MGFVKGKKLIVSTRVSKAKPVKYTVADRRIVHAMKKETKSELRSIQATLSATPGSASVGVFQSMNLTVQGDTNNNREGNQIVMQHLDVRLGFFKLAPDYGAYARIIIYYDMRNNLSTAITADLLEAAVWSSQINFSNRSRFQILSDETVGLAGDLSPAGNLTFTAGIDLSFNPAPVYHKRINLRGKVAEYVANNANAADCSKGALMIFVLISDGNSAWQVAGRSLLTFNP